MQTTKEDHTHTFLVHNIDGPALLKLTREQMLDWNVKPIDATAILRGIEQLKRIEGGDIGWALGSEDHLVIPTAPPASSKPKQPAPRKKKQAPPAEAASQLVALPQPAADGDPGADGNDEADAGEGGGGTGAESAFLTSVQLNTTSRKVERDATAELHEATTTVGATSPAYLKKIMSELHASERVPLWKEEMMERVKRVAYARQQQKDSGRSMRTGGVVTKQHPLAMRVGGRSGRGEDDRLSVGSSRAGGRLGASSKFGGGGGSSRHGGHGAPSVHGGSDAESGLGRLGATSALAREVERKLYWYQDAIHEQELQQQLLDQKIRTLAEEVASTLDKRQNDPQMKGIGAAHWEKELNKKQLREKNRLSRALQVSEERVADAERLNRATIETINKLRRGRADFLHSEKRVEERVNVMVADMKHFAAAAHASLDEKEKLEARLKRQQFDYRNELAHFEHMFGALQSELETLEERIVQGQAAEEEFLQKQRQKAYAEVRSKREEDGKRELRLGYLQNHVRQQEMDFQRLHRIMGVRFTPEKPDSVQDIVKASLSHEQRNQSLLHFVSVQNAQIEELDESVRALEAEEARLVAYLQQRAKEDVQQRELETQSATEDVAVERGIAKLRDDLRKLCPLVDTLCKRTGAEQMAAVEDGGMLQLKGVRPDTLADFLRLMDVAVKDLRARAQALPTAAGNEWLRDFLTMKEINTQPTVLQIRKDLEAAAQKQKEQKDVKAAMDGGAMPEMMPEMLAEAA